MKNRRLSLFLTFLKIGAFTFGGGYAMIALLEQPTTKMSPVSRCAACSSSSVACRACAVSFA